MTRNCSRCIIETLIRKQGSELKVLRKYIVVLLSAALAVSLSGCFLLPEEAKAPQLPLVTPYSGEEYIVAQVTRGDIRLIEDVRFEFQATRRESLKFEVSGKDYGSIQASVGDEVKAGELLAWLDVSDVERQLKQVDNDIERIKIQLAEAEDAWRLAKEAESLRGDGSTVSSDAREADAAYYRASLELQEGKRAELAEELKSLQLYATIDGTVTYAKKLKQGAVSSKADTIVVITDTTSSMFTASTTYHEMFKVGDTVSVTSDGVEYPCIVRDPEELGMETGQADLKLGRKVLCLEVQGAETPAGSGTKGIVTLELDSRENVLMLPKRAVFTVDGEYYVYFEDENGLKTARQIQCGLANDRWIEVISGLEEGDSVILR